MGIQEPCLRIFTEKGYDLKQAAHGVFHVDTPEFPIQVLVSSCMNEDDHLWLTGLKRGISESLAKKLIQASRNVRTQHEKVLVEAVLGTSMKANEELFRKILGGDGKMNKDLKELFDDFLSDRDRVRDRDVCIKTAIETMRDDGKTESEIKARLIKKYGLDEKTAEDYMNGRVA